jgi:subtilisin family serine protease
VLLTVRELRVGFERRANLKIKRFAYALVCLCAVFALLAGCVLRKAPEHRLQWWLDDLGWSEKRMKQDGSGVTVAVLDTGINAAHPDLKDKVIEEYRVASLGEPPKEHDLSHGTNVAGIICAFPATEKGVLGVAPNARILSVDITDDEEGVVETRALLEGIEYAISKKANILNISLGLSEDNAEIKKVIEKARAAGMIVVAAAGNRMKEDVLYPAKYEGVLCAGAKGKKGDLISPGKEVYNTIYLPGEYIVTADPSDRQYASVNGTSAAAPMLSGIVALILQKKPEASIKEIQESLKNSAEQTPNIPEILKKF